jgi:transcriptional regulator with XRE-family HTH domain
MPPTTLHHRIAQCIGERSSREVSELTGINAETVRRYLNGQSPPSVEFVSSLCSALNVNAHWLMTGMGPMLAVETRAEVLKDANPTELLAAVAAALERLADRVDRIESHVNALDARIHAAELAQRGGSGIDGATRSISRANGVPKAGPDRPAVLDGTLTDAAAERSPSPAR